MNNFFPNIGKNLTTNLPIIRNTASTTIKSVPCIKDVTLSQTEIEEHLKNLKGNKATGPDQISSRTLKAVGNALVDPLYHLYCKSKIWLCF